ncbi:SGNH/GDSL hydrolase family protein [Salegentibacter sediminis]|uniref:SGNH/GDSL hydrolase family protein n=1 Tax=Salegentibacter sediminis TaxID=1930251 RepID=UPI0009C04E68|nr:SGNH/GDSL hydrolase family protein [Salegentibacter sediminis]
MLTYLIATFIQVISDYGLKNSAYQNISHWKPIVQGNLNSEVLIMGSSRGAVSYNPQVIQRILNKKTQNISFDAGAFNLQKIKLDTYLRTNKPPEIFIQNVDLAHFSTSDKIPDKAQFIPYNRSEFLITQLQEIDPEFKRWNFLPLLNYNGNFKYLILSLKSLMVENNASSQDAFLGVEKKFNIDSNNLQRLEKLSNSELALKNYQPGFNSLSETLKKLPKSTKIYLVWAPEHHYRLERAAEVRNAMIKKIQDLSLTFPNVYFLNYSDHPIACTSTNFYDTFHLNYEGASRFSEILANNIKQNLK